MFRPLTGDFQLSRQLETNVGKVSVVLWDLNGTLVQTEHLHWKLETEVLATFDIDAGTMLDGCAGMRTRDALSHVLGLAGQSGKLAEVMAYRDGLVLDRIVNRALPVRGIERALNDIPMRTHRFALVTSTDRDIADAILKRFSWSWRFECVVGGDDVVHGKPSPDPYLFACEKMGVSPGEVLVVEDSIHGIAAGKAAGCRVAAIVGTELPEQLGTADYVLSNAGALPGLLRILS
jgi:HAD superfamily hydrolase (TIGR01509 family)